VLDKLALATFYVLHSAIHAGYVKAHPAVAPGPRSGRLTSTALGC
jgi:hypothetical protein